MRVHICAAPKFRENTKKILSENNMQADINSGADLCDLILFHKDKQQKKLPSAKIVLYNSDLKSSENYFKGEKIYLITYGLNAKATITASSIDERSMLICVQRSFNNISGKTVLPQELPISCPVKITDATDKIAQAALLIMLGLDIKRISSFKKLNLRKKRDSRPQTL